MVKIGTDNEDVTFELTGGSFQGMPPFMWGTLLRMMKACRETLAELRNFNTEITFKGSRVAEVRSE